MAFKMKYNKKGFPFKKTKDDPIITTSNPDIIPTSRDTIQSYIHSVIPEGLKGQIEKIDENVVEDAEKSSKLIPNMSKEDFEKAKNTLVIKTDEELLKYLTGKNKKDLPFYLRPFVKG